ncbi:hypothetical protein BH10PSE5_BH10PSE5_34320 [soil metagenome]
MGLSFDIAALRKTAGEKMFARGETYFEEGSVEVVGVDPRRIVARVFGTQTYGVELARQAKGFAGHCSCPAFADWDVCKHMIALALWGNAADPGEIEAAQERWARLRAPLLALDHEALVEMVIRLMLADPEALDAAEDGNYAMSP